MLISSKTKLMVCPGCIFPFEISSQYKALLKIYSWKSYLNNKRYAHSYSDHFKLYFARFISVNVCALLYKHFLPTINGKCTTHNLIAATPHHTIIISFTLECDARTRRVAPASTHTKPLRDLQLEMLLKCFVLLILNLPLNSNSFYLVIHMRVGVQLCMGVLLGCKPFIYIEGKFVDARTDHKQNIEQNIQKAIML